MFMTKYAPAHITISADAQATLGEDVHRRRGIEACGLLLGSIDAQGNWCVEQAHPLHNMSESPVYFEFAPEELLAAELLYPERIIGVYHSHPTGFAKASSTDRENMKRVNGEQDIPWVWLIIRGPFDEGSAHNRSLALSSLIGYHYYKSTGLCQVTIILDQTSPGLPIK
jgi:proteasome lid subunit RPN8/RPN11